MPTSQEPPAAADSVLRAITDDGAFRVVVVSMGETVVRAIAAQAVEGHAATQLGELLTAAVLVRETMSPPNRVQLVLSDASDDLVVGDAWPQGRTRGLAQVADQALGIRLLDAGRLRVERAMPRGAPHSGIVDVAADSTIAAALTSYFRHSEQIETIVGLACVGAAGDRVSACGYVVQLLPELTESPLAAMRRRLDQFAGLDAWLRRHGSRPQPLLGALLADCAYTELADSPVVFSCSCSRERAVGAAAALGAPELQELIDRGETLRLHCDYCRIRYEIGPDDFRRILDPDDRFTAGDARTAT